MHVHSWELSIRKGSICYNKRCNVCVLCHLTYLSYLLPYNFYSFSFKKYLTNQNGRQYRDYFLSETSRKEATVFLINYCVLLRYDSIIYLVTFIKLKRGVPTVRLKPICHSRIVFIV